jgi:hypothetical protein
MTDLNDIRDAIAQRAYENYDFSPEKIEAADGWERTTPGNTMTRTLYFRSTENTDDPSVKGTMTIVFAGDDSTVITECYATINGNDIGKANKIVP